MTDDTVFRAPERTTLELMLDAQRAEIGALLDEVSDDQARRRLVPSLTTLLALVQHATFVERVWFHHRVAGVPREDLGLPDTIDESFRTAADTTIDQVLADHREACEHSRRVAAGHELDEQFPWRRGPVTLRFIYLHLIQELARHAGHGDILREQIFAADADQG
ncbi:MAG TPA: DinB family protein [Marmoricola sp.]|nr:DinB family protein [Marmoricola sp.]